MSICIAIAVPDGIALAADSQITWNQTITQVKEKGTGRIVELEQPISMPISWSKMARKLFSLEMAGNKYAACIAGAAILNSKTIFSIFKALEGSYKGSADYNEIVKYFVDGLKTELKRHFKIDEISKATQILVIDFILTGYENRDVSKPIIEHHAVFSGTPIIDNKPNNSAYIKRWSNQTNSRFGGCWIGRTEFITHIVNHGKKDLPPISGQFELMSLSDTIDYTKFLVEFTCDFQRFAVMVPDCGRPIISATLTPDKYEEKII